MPQKDENSIAVKNLKISIYYVFLISGFAPSIFLLMMTLIFIPGLLMSFELSLEWFALISSCLFGIGGFIGFLRLFNKEANQNSILNILLLLSGVAGSIIFMTVTVGMKRALEWTIKFEEPDEWFLFTWPIIVALTFAIIISIKRFKRVRFD
jgi:hypothetical protein